MTGISACQTRTTEACVKAGLRGRAAEEELRDRANVGRLRALLPLGCLVLDACALGERLEAVAGDGAEVHEQVLRPVLRRDEAVALLVAEPLHGACSQLIHLPCLTSASAGRGGSCTRASAGRCAYLWSRTSSGDQP